MSQFITNAELRIEAERLIDENEKLRNQLEDEKAENGWAREFLNRIGPKCGTKDCPSLVAYVGKLEAENEKLRVELTDLRLKSCPSCGIKVENEKLRHELEMDTFRGLGEIEAYKREASVASRKLAQAEAENEKLRELIRHMHCCSNNEYTEYGIDFIASHCKDCEYGNDFGHCNFERRMAELGIEVN